MTDTATDTGRARIMDEAATLFVQQGYEATSLRHLADVVGMKAGSLYYHFASKDELLTEILRRGIEVMETAFDEADRATSGADAATRVAAHVRAHLAANLHGQDTAVNLLADAVCDHVASPRPNKPLVASLHGSPGIGKSYFHQLLAQALYNATGDGSHPEEDAFGNPIEPDAGSDHQSGAPWGGNSNGNSNGGNNAMVDALSLIHI